MLLKLSCLSGKKKKIMLMSNLVHPKAKQCANELETHKNQKANRIMYHPSIISKMLQFIPHISCLCSMFMLMLILLIHAI